MRRLLVFLTLSLGLAFGQDDDPPNIILFLCDDLRPDVLGAMGHIWAQTPNIDQLANDGTVFHQAFATTAICVTSRCNILTGQHAIRTGWRMGEMRGKELTAEQLNQTYLGKLKQAGYKVGYAGKWHVGKVPADFFDHNAAYEGQGKFLEAPDAEHLTSKLAGEAEKMVANSGEDPIFLCVGFKAPHQQDGKTPPFYIYDEKLTGELYKDVELDPPPLSDERFFKTLPEFLQTSLSRERWSYRFGTPELFDESVRGYHRLVAGVDHAVGRVLKAVEAAGKTDNTVIMFTSDHGVYLGARGFAEKFYPHEPSIRIPLIVLDPRVPEGKRGWRDEMALTIDIAPTILNLAGVQVPGEMQGVSLVPLVNGNDVSDWRQEFFYDHKYIPDKIPPTAAVRTTRWKYIRYVNSDPLYEELYDLENDPNEERNLIGSPYLKFVHDLMIDKWKQLKEAAK
ncbi:MAG: sulfatase-like hydrolase/transferase [Verrucomicrobiota bacterium]